MLFSAAALLIVASLAFVAACSPPPGARSGGDNGGLDGFWLSDGYGLLFDIRGAQMRILQTTKISCAEVASARRSTDTPAGSEAAFVVAKDQSLPVLDVDSGLLTISTGRAPDVIRLRVDGAISDIVLHRAASAPATCATPPANTPLNNFDIFWETFREHYPFFALHDMDWDAARTRFRPRVTDATTRAQLHAIFIEMIKPLGDAHTFVDLDSANLEFEGERPDPQPLTSAERDRVDEIVDGRLAEKRQFFASNQLSFGRLHNGMGYLEIRSFSNYTDSGRISEALAELDRALDVALAKPMTGLVIDVRDNDGGSDVLGVGIASRLTREPYTAYVKTARNDPDDPGRLTDPQTIKVQPSNDTVFTGRVALLTSRYSVSAAETFAQALFGRPGVVRIGENTQGVFSDVLNRALPNGMIFGLPNEIYETDGKAYDKVGIAPDIDTGLVFKRSNLEAGRDPELDAAMSQD
jgi:hypothetical protein